MSYFQLFPQVDYNNTAAINIMSRVKIIDTFKQVKTNFYPYTVVEGERPDVVSYGYYNDPDEEWVIFHTNDVIDPYHDWTMSDEVFIEFIKGKYGTVVNAQSQILYWRNNWASDTSKLNTAGYEALPGENRQYWTPSSDADTIVSYVRISEDWTIDTNTIQELTINLSTTNTFSDGEVLRLEDSGLEVGNAVVQYATNTTVIFHHVQGSFANVTNTSYNLFGVTSTANATASESQIISQPISNNVAVYYDPVTAYDVEEEKNRERKDIQLIDATLLSSVKRELRTLLRE